MAHLTQITYELCFKLLLKFFVNGPGQNVLLEFLAGNFEILLKLLGHFRLTAGVNDVILFCFVSSCYAVAYLYQLWKRKTRSYVELGITLRTFEIGHIEKLLILPPK